MALKRKTAIDYSERYLELEEGLRIDDKNVWDETARHPELLYEVCKNLAMLISKRDAAKSELKNIQADAYLDIRKAPIEEGEKKPTEKEMESLVLHDVKVREATMDMHDLERLVGKYQALKEGYIARGFALRDLVSMSVANFHSDTSNGTARHRQIMERRRT